MKEYITKIDINATKETVWNTITDFKNYPKWNSVLVMKNNDNLTLGNKFNVTINKPKNKQSNFKAIAIHKENFSSFSATQKIMGKWFFEATHYFIIREIDKESIIFIQKWELKGIIASIFRKQIFKELALFTKMNDELKALVEK